MWFIGVEVEQETSAPPPKKNPGSAPGRFKKLRDVKTEVNTLVKKGIQSTMILKKKARSFKNQITGDYILCVMY